MNFFVFFMASSLLAILNFYVSVGFFELPGAAWAGLFSLASPGLPWASLGRFGPGSDFRPKMVPDGRFRTLSGYS